MRVVEEALPAAIVLENVEGLAYESKAEGLRLLLDRIADINQKTGSNYQPRYQVLKASRYGVPQHRSRFILVAARDGAPFRFPAATHGDAGDGDGPLFAPLKPTRTAWDALGDLDAPPTEEDLAVKGKWAGLLPSIPEGENYLFHTDRGDGEPLFGWRRRYWSFLLKLAKRLPSWTIQAQPGPAVGPFHWDNRRLSMRELCRLQTFPDDVYITGSRAAVQRQIGNAVPSLLAEVLGREIRHQLLGRGRLRRALRLLPTKKQPMPEPRTASPVPPEYHHLRGQHDAHPGTERGYGAARRVAVHSA